MTRHVIPTMLALALCAHAGLAFAQPGSDKAAAEALFAEGRALMKQGQQARACEKFAASHRLEPSVGALLNLGDCQEKRGKLASAWASFREAAALASRLGDAVRSEFAMQRAEAVHDRLSYLTIAVPESSRVSGLAITRNDEPVDEALWNQRAPVDPGPYVIRAEAPGRERLEVRVDVRLEADQVTVTIAGLRPVREAGPETGPEAETTLQRAPARASGAAMAPGTAQRGPTSPARVRAAPGMPARRKLAFVSGGVSAAALATGVVLGLRARSRWDEAMSHCADLVCDPTGIELGEQARRLGHAASIGYIAGGVAAVAGAYLWFTARPRTADSRDTHVIGPLLAPDMAGIQVHTRF
jgi:tetratricopeptide (TPR) repeat protein